MSDWNDLPKGFLRLGFNRWLRFEPELRDLIVKLAREQKLPVRSLQDGSRPNS
jgi:hypothetical protein